MNLLNIDDFNTLINSETQERVYSSSTEIIDIMNNLIDFVDDINSLNIFLKDGIGNNKTCNVKLHEQIIERLQEPEIIKSLYYSFYLITKSAEVMENIRSYVICQKNEKEKK